MNPGSLWITVGICTGVAAGVLGAYVAWRRSKRTYGAGVTTGTATLTLILAVAAAVSVFKVQTSWEHRLCLLLAPAFLVYWFVSQVRAIRAERRGRGCNPRHEV
jgi:hypothetical protein